MIKALENLKNKFRKRKVLKALIQRYENELELEFLMEKWIMECIVTRGQQDRRAELSKMQEMIKERQLFIEYFKRLDK